VISVARVNFNFSFSSLVSIAVTALYTLALNKIIFASSLYIHLYSPKLIAEITA